MGLIGQGSNARSARNNERNTGTKTGTIRQACREACPPLVHIWSASSLPRRATALRSLKGGANVRRSYEENLCRRDCRRGPKEGAQKHQRGDRVDGEAGPYEGQPESKDSSVRQTRDKLKEARSHCELRRANQRGLAARRFPSPGLSGSQLSSYDR